MARVNYQVTVEVEVSDANAELLKVAGRELISGINVSLDQNQNVDDIKVSSIQASVSLNVDCMPDKEIDELAAQ